MTDAPARLQAKLANVLWRTARREQARQAFLGALRTADRADVRLRAHLHTRLGRLEMADHDFDAALEAFDAAEALLGKDPTGADDATVEQWLEMMVDGRADLYAMRNEPDLALAALQAARPVLEARGSPARTCSFYHVLAIGRVIQNRFRVDETDIANIRRSAAAAAQGNDEKDVGYASFFVGLLMCLSGDLAQAQAQLETALSLAERIGESILLGESLLALTLTALRRHDVTAVRSLAPRAVAAASGMASERSEAEARAFLVWLAWQDGRPEDVITSSKRIAAQEATVADGGSRFRKWLYLWPLIAACLETGQVADAVAAARELVHPAQQWLPDDLTARLDAAFSAWEQDRPDAAREELAAALALANELRYF